MQRENSVMPRGAQCLSFEDYTSFLEIFFCADNVYAGLSKWKKASFESSSIRSLSDTDETLGGFLKIWNAQSIKVEITVISFYPGI